MNGVIVIDKPKNFTSFDVVAVMRKLCGTKKVGHTGTLDPMATGVLPILIGSATKAQDLTPETQKEYIASFRFGLTTDTQDITGTVTGTRPVHVDERRLLKALDGFRGEILQIPPMYSALRKNGVRLYDLAREGVVVEREARPVTVYELELLYYDESGGEGGLRVRCSKGTYIRTLCADLGERLGCGAVLTELRRTMACGFALSDSITLERARALKEQDKLSSTLLSLEKLFAVYAPAEVTEAQAMRFQNGGGLALGRTGLKNARNGEVYRVYGPKRRFLGLGIINRELEELSVYKLFPN